MKLKLSSIENRRRRGDLINNIDDINLHNPIDYFNANSRVRGHNLKIHRELVNTHSNFKFNTQLGTTSSQIELQETINSLNVNQFKNHIDKHFKF